MATPRIGLNSQLRIGTTTSYTSATQIGYVTTVTPNLEADEADVTPITSTGHSEFIPGKRSATLAFDVAYDRSDTQHALLASQWSAGGTNYYWVAMPSFSTGTTTNSTDWMFRGFITSLSPGIDPSDKHSASVTVRVTEAPTIA